MHVFMLLSRVCCSMWFRLFSELLQLIQWLYLSQPSALPAVAQYLVSHLDGVVVDGHKTGKPLPSMSSLWEGIQQTISPRIPPFLCFSKERMLMMPSDIDSDTPFDQVSLLPPLSRLDAHSLLVLYTSMLCERRIVFVSRYLSTLSACVHGALSLLYPMTWQVRSPSLPSFVFVCFVLDGVHAILVVLQQIFIPIVPREMLPYCSAPSPFVVGLRPSEFERLQDLEVKEVRSLPLLDHVFSARALPPPRELYP